MTQLDYARKNIVTPVMKKISAEEGVNPGLLLKRIKDGTVVIPLNNTRSIPKPCGVGLGLRTKINANIGTSTDQPQIADELKKLLIAVQYGADTVMDLSVGGDLNGIRRKIMKASAVPVGTVPIYEIAVNAQKQKKHLLNFTVDDILSVLETQAKSGVDFFTIHSGVTRESTAVLQKNKRLMGIVSRGGAIIASWMRYNKKENPFFEYFDEIISIASRYDVTLSLGDGLRPGSVLDATDKAQLAELKILGELALRARRKNVQVMIEGPGHVPLDQVEKNVILEKKFCHGAPFYVLGPLVTDIAPGYDHITSAIGGAIAASHGADFLCFVTPAEHLRHPSVDDVKEGVIASKIAAHAGDIIKRKEHALLLDRNMSEARAKRDWKKQIALSIDPQKAGQYRKSSLPDDKDVCTMCGDYCSIKLMDEYLH